MVQRTSAIFSSSVSSVMPVSLRESSPKSSNELRDVSGEDNAEEAPAFSSLTSGQS